MKDIIINVDSTSHKVNFPDEFLGIGYENLQGNLIFQFDNNFIGGEARLEVSIDEESGIIPSLTHYENGYILPIKSSLLTGTNVLMQLVIDETSLTKYTLTTDTQVNQNKTYYEKVGNDYLPVENPNAHDLPTYYEANTPVFKTDIFSLKVKDSINAQETIPEQYPTWINTFNILVATLNQKLLLVDQALTEMDNLNISVSNKVNGEVTIIFTDKEGNVKVVKINDGRGIVSITKTGTIGNVDTYTIKYTDNTTSTFQVTNGIDGTDGVGIESIYFKGTSGLTDTYTILYTDGTTTEFQVKNGRGITKIEKISTNLLVDTYKITFNDGTTQNYEITNGKSIVSIEKTSTDNLTDIYTITYNDNTITTFNVVNGKGIVSIEKTSTSGYVDTYTITYNDGTTTTYEVTNGEVSQAQLDALQDELNYYKTIVNALPKITGTGTYIALNNTADSIMFNVYSPSALNQETTTGKQLFVNIPTQTVNNVTLTNNGDGSYTLNGLCSASANIQLQSQTLEAGDYTLQCKYEGTLPNNSSPRVQIYVGALSYVLQVSNNASNDSVSTENLSSDTTGAQFRIRIENGFNYQNVKLYPLLVKGIYTSSTIGDFEPYTGGIPAPNPSYPMPIHTISGNNKAVVEGKNLAKSVFDTKLKIEGTGNNRTVSTSTAYCSQIIKVKPNTTYTCSGDFSNMPNNMIRIGYFDETPIVNSTTTNYVYGESPYIFTTGATTNYIMLFNSNSNNDTTISNLMLNYGSTPLSYTPYTSQEVNINLGNIEYCKIGNYEDRIFQNVVGDVDYDSSRELGKWYIKKNIGKVVLDGSENWLDYPNTATGLYKAYTQTYRLGFTNLLDTPGICDYFEVLDDFKASYTKVGLGFTKNALYIAINNSIANSTSDLALWLNTHNTTIYYPLATPTYELLSNDIQNALNTVLMSYSGQTNISQINNDLPFIIDSTALKDLTNL